MRSPLDGATGERMALYAYYADFEKHFWKVPNSGSGSWSGSRTSRNPTTTTGRRSRAATGTNPCACWKRAARTRRSITAKSAASWRTAATNRTLCPWQPSPEPPGSARPRSPCTGHTPSGLTSLAAKLHRHAVATYRGLDARWQLASALEHLAGALGALGENEPARAARRERCACSVSSTPRRRSRWPDVWPATGRRRLAVRHHGF
jgi:hypothetical protein